MKNKGFYIKYKMNKKVKNLIIAIVIILFVIVGTTYVADLNRIKDEEQTYFYGKVIESSEKYIIVEPNEGEEGRQSSDKIAIGLGENKDMIYAVGTNVKVTYNGLIMESYPAQIKATNIEIESAEKID